MANMSYCRFHNTVLDLEDCKEALENGDISSLKEKNSAKGLIELCREIADNFDDDYVDSIRTEEEEEEDEEED